MVAGLCDLALLHNDDMVCIHYGGQAMCNHDGRYPAELFFHDFYGLDYLSLILFIQSAGCLVEYK